MVLLLPAHAAAGATSLLSLAAASAFVMPSPVAAAPAPTAPLRSSASTAVTSCASNATHCGWINHEGKGEFEDMAAAKARMTDYLWQNLMPYDVPRARTLGFDEKALALSGEDVFGTDGGSVARIALEKGNVDGLSDGVLNQTLHYALEAKKLYPWTDAIPRSIYLEYVVPYAVVNEPRSDHRPLLFEALKDMLQGFERPEDASTEQLTTNVGSLETRRLRIKQAVKLINTKSWAKLGRPDQPIVFKAGLTPRIYDPLSVMAYGHSSCTGLAILFVSALRAVGIPARMAGTPAWHGNDEEGNHSWVEVYLPTADGGTAGKGGGEWIFIEPSPGIAEGDEDKANADDLDRDPCKRWFCNAARFDGSTRVYATRFDKEGAGTHYPMAWSAKDDEGVPGEDRTEYYTGICGKCAH